MVGVIFQGKTVMNVAKAFFDMENIFVPWLKPTAI
jgi:hypothetical protein